jgi:hypothetical protein
VRFYRIFHYRALVVRTRIHPILFGNNFSNKFFKLRRIVVFNPHRSKVSFRKKNTVLIVAISFSKKDFLPDSGLVDELFAEQISELETQRSMYVNASPKVLLKENKDRSFLLFFECGFIDKLSFFCIKLLSRVPNINDVIEIDFV